MPVSFLQLTCCSAATTPLFVEELLFKIYPFRFLAGLLIEVINVNLCVCRWQFADLQFSQFIIINCRTIPSRLDEIAIFNSKLTADRRHHQSYLWQLTAGGHRPDTSLWSNHIKGIESVSSLHTVKIIFVMPQSVTAVTSAREKKRDQILAVSVHLHFN